MPKVDITIYNPGYVQDAIRKVLSGQGLDKNERMALKILDNRITTQAKGLLKG